MDCIDYEYNRNCTLLFFLEKLFEKRPRSLHDLSCQFGTKGFSKEMRQIAGGSQSGLRKFLSQYPSLFTLDGQDSVTITESSPNKIHSSDSRNYTKEAMGYFKEKLKSYGVGTEVPIRSLLGHRSQAPPEVRHISGQHIREFRDFLNRFPNEFVVKDEIIYLKEYEGTIRMRFNEENEKSDENEYNDKIDQFLANQFIAFIKERLSERDSLSFSVSSLFNDLRNKFPPETISHILSTEADFVTFIQIYPHYFTITNSCVSLVSKVKDSILPKNIPEYREKEKEEEEEKRDEYKNQSLKQRLSFVVNQMIAENTGKERVCKTTNLELLVEEPLRPKVIVSVKDSALLIEFLMGKGSPVGFDGEGINFPKGHLSIIILGTLSGQIYIFDLQTCPRILTDGNLKKLLENENITKVIHNCSNHSAALHFQHGIQLKNVFDTQAAHAILQYQETGKPVHKVKNVSLNTLCEMYGAKTNVLKEQYKAVTRKDQKYWGRRPLSKDMILYASSDVITLCTTLYPELSRKLKQESTSLLMELCEEQVMLNINPEDVKLRKKQRKIECEVSDLKLKFATSDHRNIVLSNREIRLLRYLQLTDEDKEKLKGSYKVAKKLEKIEQRENRSPDDEDREENLFSLDSIESNLEESPDSSLSPTELESQEPLELTTLTEAMDLVEEILANDSMDRLERIDKLEAILAKASNLNINGEEYSEFSLKREVSTQTLSTGDIVMTKVYTSEY